MGCVEQDGLETNMFLLALGPKSAPITLVWIKCNCHMDHTTYQNYCKVNNTDIENNIKSIFNNLNWNMTTQWLLCLLALNNSKRDKLITLYLGSVMSQVAPQAITMFLVLKMIF